MTHRLSGWKVGGDGSRRVRATIPRRPMKKSLCRMAGRCRKVVKLEGTVPKPKGTTSPRCPIPITCGRISDGEGWRILQPFNVGPKGRVREVVVYLEGIEKGSRLRKRGAANRSQGLPVPTVYDCRA